MCCTFRIRIKTALMVRNQCKYYKRTAIIYKAKDLLNKYVNIFVHLNYNGRLVLISEHTHLLETLVKPYYKRPFNPQITHVHQASTMMSIRPEGTSLLRPMLHNLVPRRYISTSTIMIKSNTKKRNQIIK